jgi:preprotein translocase subunit SecG
VLTKTTYILGTIFLLTSFGLAMVNRTPGDSGVEAAAKQATTGAQSEWWIEKPAANAAPAPAADAPSADAPAQPAN